MKKEIEKLVDVYNSFQQAYGKEVSLNYPFLIELIFSKDFKKIANQEELVSDRAGLEPQLENVKALFGSWEKEVKYIIPSACGTKCTLRYTLKSEKAGDFDVFAVLTSQDGKHIDVIDEIYREIEK